MLSSVFCFFRQSAANAFGTKPSTYYTSVRIALPEAQDKPRRLSSKPKIFFGCPLRPVPVLCYKKQQQNDARRGWGGGGGVGTDGSPTRDKTNVETYTEYGALEDLSSPRVGSEAQKQSRLSAGMSFLYIPFPRPGTCKLRPHATKPVIQPIYNTTINTVPSQRVNEITSPGWCLQLDGCKGGWKIDSLIHPTLTFFCPCMFQRCRWSEPRRGSASTMKWRPWPGSLSLAPMLRRRWCWRWGGTARVTATLLGRTPALAGWLSGRGRKVSLNFETTTKRPSVEWRSDWYTGSVEGAYCL